MNKNTVNLLIAAAFIGTTFFTGCEIKNSGKPQQSQVQALKADSSVTAETTDVQQKHVSQTGVPGSKKKQKKEVVIHEEFNAELWDNVVNKDLTKTKESLVKGADVNARAFGEWTPLMRAVSDRNIEMCILLIENGANVNAREKNNNPIIAFACGNNNTDIVKLLLKNKAKANVKNSEGMPVLAVTASHGIDNVKLLIENGAEVNMTDRNGKTALMVACSYGRADVAKYLIDKGADVNAKMADGSTALSIIQNNIGKEMTEVRRLLKAAGAEETVVEDTKPDLRRR